MVRGGNSGAYEARIAGHRRVKQVTKWKSLDPDTVKKFLEANPGFIDKHRKKTGKDKRERIYLMGLLREAEINSSCVSGERLDLAPILAHNSPDILAFCEAVRNHLEQFDCANYISKDGSAVLCAQIDETDYRNDYDCLILMRNINITYRLLLTRKDKYVFAMLKTPVKRTPTLQKGCMT